MTIDTSKTVRELAVQVPNAARTFEALGIDYCCGGNQPLEKACAEANLSIGDVVEKLSAIPEGAAEGAPETDWNQHSLTMLMDHIVMKHHRYVKSELPRLQQLCEKVISKHGATHPETKVVGGLLGALAHELEMHLMKEENILFPYIRQMEQQRGSNPASCFGTVRNPIHMMELEHDSAGEGFRRMREVTSNFTPPTDACATYRALYSALTEFEADLHQHIHLENNILHPRAIELETSRS